MVVEAHIASGVVLRPMLRVPEEAKRGQCPPGGRRCGYETVLDTDGIGRQGEPDGRYASLGDAVGDQAIFRVCLFEKIFERQALNVRSKLVNEGSLDASMAAEIEAFAAVPTLGPVNQSKVGRTFCRNRGWQDVACRSSRLEAGEATYGVDRLARRVFPHGMEFRSCGRSGIHGNRC